MSKEELRRQVAIIGSGPAGLTAAIYAARANLQPLLIDAPADAENQTTPGGQLMITTDVENYPGFAEGIQGPELMVEFRKQAERFGTEFLEEWITHADLSERPFTLYTDNSVIKAETLIIASGASAKWLGIESEQRLNGYGVSACAVCDGFFFKGREVAVIGAGDTAAEEALYLSKICSHVYMIVRKSEMKASKVMQERVFKSPNIKVYWHHETDEVLGDKRVEAVRIKNNQTGEKQEIPVSAFFVAIGHQPNSDIFKDWIDMDDAGYIKTIPGSSKTNIEGVFAAGDVQDKIYRQAVTAAGSGCMAALDAERYLSAKGLAC